LLLPLHGDTSVNLKCLIGGQRKLLTFRLNGTHEHISIAKFFCIRIFIIVLKINFGLLIHWEVDKSMADAQNRCCQPSIESSRTFLHRVILTSLQFAGFMPTSQIFLCTLCCSGVGNCF
jgi:hypothetical protein